MMRSSVLDVHNKFIDGRSLICLPLQLQLSPFIIRKEDAAFDRSPPEYIIS